MHWTKNKNKNIWQTQTLVHWLFTVLRPAQESFTYMETSPLPVKDCKRPISVLRALEQGATPAVTLGLSFSGLIQRTAPFSHLLQHTRGCRWSTLTQIFTGPHSVASYDTQGEVEDLLYPDLRGSPFSRLLRHSRGCGGSTLPRSSQVSIFITIVLQ
jgi:hypothetical protein